MPKRSSLFQRKLATLITGSLILSMTAGSEAAFHAKPLISIGVRQNHFLTARFTEQAIVERLINFDRRPAHPKVGIVPLSRRFQCLLPLCHAAKISFPSFLIVIFSPALAWAQEDRPLMNPNVPFAPIPDELIPWIVGYLVVGGILYFFGVRSFIRPLPLAMWQPIDAHLKGRPPGTPAGRVSLLLTFFREHLRQFPYQLRERTSPTWHLWSLPFEISGLLSNHPFLKRPDIQRHFLMPLLLLPGGKRRMNDVIRVLEDVLGLGDPHLIHQFAYTNPELLVKTLERFWMKSLAQNYCRLVESPLEERARRAQAFWRAYDRTVWLRVRFGGIPTPLRESVQAVRTHLQQSPHDPKADLKSLTTTLNQYLFVPAGIFVSRAAPNEAFSEYLHLGGHPVLFRCFPGLGVMYRHQEWIGFDLNYIREQTDAHMKLWDYWKEERYHSGDSRSLLDRTVSVLPSALRSQLEDPHTLARRLIRWQLWEEVWHALDSFAFEKRQREGTPVIKASSDLSAYVQNMPVASNELEYTTLEIAAYFRHLMFIESLQGAATMGISLIKASNTPDDPHWAPARFVYQQLLKKAGNRGSEEEAPTYLMETLTTASLQEVRRWASEEMESNLNLPLEDDARPAIGIDGAIVDPPAIRQLLQKLYIAYDSGPRDEAAASHMAVIPLPRNVTHVDNQFRDAPLWEAGYSKDTQRHAESKVDLALLYSAVGLYYANGQYRHSHESGGQSPQEAMKIALELSPPVWQVCRQALEHIMPSLEGMVPEPRYPHHYPVVQKRLEDFVRISQLRREILPNVESPPSWEYLGTTLAWLAFMTGGVDSRDVLQTAVDAAIGNVSDFARNVLKQLGDPARVYETVSLQQHHLPLKRAS